MSATIIELKTNIRRPSERAVANVEASAIAELRRARIRIAQLEASLTLAMRDSLKHFDRARQAERQLAELLDEEDTRESGKWDLTV